MKFLRTFMHSRIGVLVALGFLVLIALAFAAGDVAGMRQSLSGGGGDRVATVGGRKIDGAELAQAATTALEQLKRDDPRLSMRAFIAGGGLAGALDQTIDREALAEFGNKHGLLASDRLVDSEIAKIPAFQGPDGKFSEAAYRALLAQRGLSDATVRSDLASGLIARQLLVPAGFGAKMPGGLVARYAALLSERRNGAIALLPAA
ncbi:MAG TPA: SurA N-terminal domain-containing protein, partial [Novosphingobium sp.]